MGASSHTINSFVLARGIVQKFILEAVSPFTFYQEVNGGILSESKCTSAKSVAQSAKW